VGLEINNHSTAFPATHPPSVFWLLAPGPRPPNQSNQHNQLNPSASTVHPLRLTALVGPRRVSVSPRPRVPRPPWRAVALAKAAAL
jgi:hypothetical protein